MDMEVLSFLSDIFPVGALNKRFTQTLDSHVYNVLNTMAEGRGISLEKLLRNVIVPDWMQMVSEVSRPRSKTAERLTALGRRTLETR